VLQKNIVKKLTRNINSNPSVELKICVEIIDVKNMVNNSKALIKTELIVCRTLKKQ
jgi:hypothetical protein